jgi:hypothetical protein
LLELQICVSIIIIAFLALCNDSYEFEEKETSTWCVVISCSPMVMFAVLSVGLMTKSSIRVKHWTQARYQLIGLHLQRSFAPMAELKQQDLVSMLSSITPSDRHALVTAADIIMAECCGQQARQSRFRQRLIANPDKKIITKSNVNGLSINRDASHPTAECQFLQLDAALPSHPAIEAMKLIAGCGSRDSAEEMIKTSLTISQDMCSGEDKKPADDQKPQW